MRRVIIQGATGSVGTSVLSVIREHPDEFAVTGLASHRPGDAILRLAGEFPDAMIAVTADPDASFRQRLENAGRGKVFTGPDALARMTAFADAEMCVSAVSGTAGLAGAFVAAERGLTILLANKEVLVSAGSLFMALVKKSGGTVLPVDSEHAALWQCFQGRDPAQVARLIITASGGPFFRSGIEEMRAATPESALRHPVWNMGAKISIDSATLANKALEVLEARSLYGIDNVDVLVHPQSVVHGMIEWRDGSTIAHMGVSDMRQPIGYMLFYPGPAEWKKEQVDLAKAGPLEFYEPDWERFPMLGLGLAAGKAGGLNAAWFNAANEEAVAMFLRKEIGFTDIFRVVEKAMAAAPKGDAEDLAQVFEEHAKARNAARAHLKMM